MDRCPSVKRKTLKYVPILLFLMDVLITLRVRQIVDGNIGKDEFCSIDIIGDSVKEAEAKMQILVDILNRGDFHVE